MKRGRHAAGDGSFARSASVNAGRGAILIAVAVLIGFVLLHDLDRGGVSNVVTSRPRSTTPRSTAPLPTIPATTTTPAHAPKDVKVLVVNGTTVAGAASRVAQPLKVNGYNVLRAVDASAAIKAATKASAVYYVTRDYEKDAKALQAALALPPTPVTAVPTPPPAPEVSQANVVIVVGPDLARAGTSATTTTRAGTSPTTGRSTTTTR
ncbi:MAG: LytR cell envelope-related transcriptional attenuator [Actinomycetota bacterium]|nr:LytR cell envelope-related transcriptional attenuator [Actinomycetota bacterium]